MEFRGTVERVDRVGVAIDVENGIERVVADESDRDGYVTRTDVGRGDGDAPGGERARDGYSITDPDFDDRVVRVETGTQRGNSGRNGLHVGTFMSGPG